VATAAAREEKEYAKAAQLVSTWRRRLLQPRPQVEPPSELELLQAREHVLAVRVQNERSRTGEAHPHCLSMLLLERVWDELAAAG
jgi:hypothetical protein